MLGQTVSRYKILEKVGEGVMGVVYKAEDTKTRRTVALKFVHPNLTRSKKARPRLKQEARIAASLDHPNICTIHDIQDEAGNGQMFIVMAYYEGEPLNVKIAAHGVGLPVDEAMSTAIQIAQGLVWMHEAGVVHLDLKPANIFITHRSEVKIMDFGLAQLAPHPKSLRRESSCGTVAYLSPEQCEGEAADERTDIWSLGVTLYEMLTSKLPFQGEVDQAVIYGIANEDPTQVTRLRPEISAELEAIVTKTMAKEPHARYQRVEAVLADLQRSEAVLAEGQSTNDRPSSLLPAANSHQNIFSALLHSLVGWVGF